MIVVTTIVVDQNATIVVGVTTIVVFATIVFGVATIANIATIVITSNLSGVLNSILNSKFKLVM